MTDLVQEREEMIERQLRKRGIRDERILSAMREVPREEFVRQDLVEFAYQDAPLPIEEEQTISQPYVVALMAQLLDLKEEDKVLDVGTGSGYAAAVISRIASNVYTIERHKALAETAGKRFANLGYDNIHVMHGDGTEGWPEHAPFDAISVAAGGPDVPQPLKDQLAEGGRLVIPIGSKPRSQRLVRMARQDGDIKEQNMGRVQFVPLIGAAGWTEGNGNPIPKKQTIDDLIGHAAEPITDIETTDIAGLLRRIDNARVVLMGEATHGTAEFYDMRARITRELIERKGFNIVAVEADWPDAAHIDY